MKFLWILIFTISGVLAQYAPLIIDIDNIDALRAPLDIDQDFLDLFRRLNHHSYEYSFYIIEPYNTDIKVTELIIYRYPGSAVFKNPFFKPAKGFKSIVDKSNKLLHPFVELYAQHIRDRSNHPLDLARLYFYMERDQFIEQNESIVSKFKNIFSKPKPIKEHVLLKKLRLVSKSQNDQLDVKDKWFMKLPMFEQTRIFVHPDITLQDLQTKINVNIKAINDAYYLNDESDQVYTLFNRLH